jgi:hypothetical protein
MKTTAALWLLFAWPVLATAADTPFKCVLSAEKTTLAQGEIPILKVSISNDSGKDVHLVGSLDGSDLRRRFPHCILSLLDPMGKPLPRKGPIGVCGNMNRLRSADFVKIPAGSAFDLYGDGFFGSFEILRIKELPPGTYILRFYYKTSTKAVQDYFGDERLTLSTEPLVVSPEIQKLFESVPDVDIQSNDLKITVIP